MVLPLLGPAIAAGGSFLSGLFGRSSAKKQAKKEEDAIRKANDVATANAQQMNRELRARADAAALVPVQTSSEHAERTASFSASGVDMAAFMSAAENYGFNPLTFLRSGALSLFATNTSISTHETMDWTCTTGERAMEAAMQGSYLPQLQPVIAQTRVPGMGDVLGDALQSGANQYLNELNQQENNEFQMRLLNAKLGGANARPSGSPALSRSFYAPTAFHNGSVATVVPPTSGGWGEPASAPVPEYFLGGGMAPFKPNPDKRTPLKEFEKDYGNEVPDFIGIGRFLYDWMLTPALRDMIDERVHFAPTYHERRTTESPPEGFRRGGATGSWPNGGSGSW